MRGPPLALVIAALPALGTDCAALLRPGANRAQRGGERARPRSRGPIEPEQRAAFGRASVEYIETQRYNADRAEARVNFGTFYAYRGDAAQAEAEINTAIALDPDFVPAYVNLADLYRAMGRDADGERSLREGLDIVPGHASLHDALGLALGKRCVVDRGGGMATD